jgi:hypothetical protein
MNIQKWFEADSDELLEGTGGEPLTGSGFENEIPDPNFSAVESTTEREGK